HSRRAIHRGAAGRRHGADECRRRRLSARLCRGSKEVRARRAPDRAPQGGRPALGRAAGLERSGVPDMTDELAFMTIAEAARLIGRKQLSPVELATALIRRTEALDAQLNAYLLPTFERALDQAGQAEQEITAGNYRGPMHGIPFALKDIYS